MKIVDEFTGRTWKAAAGARVHQAIEAKEGVSIQEEHVTLATITPQNEFRLYDKLDDRNGEDRGEESDEIYDLDVVQIRTNVDVARDDKNDAIFRMKERRSSTPARPHRRAARQGPAGCRCTIDVEASEHLLRDVQAARQSAQRAEREAASSRPTDHQGCRPTMAWSRSRPTWPVRGVH